MTSCHCTPGRAHNCHALKPWAPGQLACSCRCHSLTLADIVARPSPFRRAIAKNMTEKTELGGYTALADALRPPDDDPDAQAREIDHLNPVFRGIQLHPDAACVRCGKPRNTLTRGPLCAKCEATIEYEDLTALVRDIRLHAPPPTARVSRDDPDYPHARAIADLQTNVAEVRRLAAVPPPNSLVARALPPRPSIPTPDLPTASLLRRTARSLLLWCLNRT